MLYTVEIEIVHLLVVIKTIKQILFVTDLKFYNIVGRNMSRCSGTVKHTKLKGTNSFSFKLYLKQNYSGLRCSEFANNECVV